MSTDHPPTSPGDSLFALLVLATLTVRRFKHKDDWCGDYERRKEK